jgi:hypothetical protein
VRDHDHRAPWHKSRERILDGIFGITVEGRCRLVEEKQRGVLEKCTCDGDALALAARQFHTTIADDGRKALRQSFDDNGQMAGPPSRRCAMAFGMTWGEHLMLVAVSAVLAGILTDCIRFVMANLTY